MAPDASPSDPTRSLRATFKGISSVVAPTSAVTALLYYFGWTRTSIEATQLGLDESLLGYTTQDYLLRSMSSMLAPLVIGLVAILAALAFHAVLMAWVRRVAPTADPAADVRRGRRLLGRVVAGIVALGLTVLALGFAGTQERRPSEAMYLAAPVGVTVGIVLLVYAVNLYRRLLVARGPRAATAPFEGYGALVTTSIVMLLLVSLFWNVSHYAAVKGRRLAATVETRMPSQPGVIIFSAKRLYLQAPVVETKLDPENAAYNYAYTGLKLLFRSDHRYFLRPSDSHSRMNIVIPDGLDIRLELYRA